VGKIDPKYHSRYTSAHGFWNDQRKRPPEFSYFEHTRSKAVIAQK
jgi:hypothetical protein